MKYFVCAAVALAAMLATVPAADACGGPHRAGVAGDLMEASDDAARIGDFSLAVVYAKLAAARAQAAAAPAFHDLEPFLKTARGYMGRTALYIDDAAAKAAGHHPSAYDRQACLLVGAEDQADRWQRALAYVARAGRSEASLDAAWHLPNVGRLPSAKTAIIEYVCPE